MKLQNTREYYCDLAMHYFGKGRIHLASYFRGIAESKRLEFNDIDDADWFWFNNIERPERDIHGHYIVN